MQWDTDGKRSTFIDCALHVNGAIVTSHHVPYDARTKTGAARLRRDDFISEQE